MKQLEENSRFSPYDLDNDGTVSDDEIDKANKKTKSIIKSTMETLNNLIPRRK